MAGGLTSQGCTPGWFAVREEIERHSQLVSQVAWPCCRHMNRLEHSGSMGHRTRPLPLEDPIQARRRQRIANIEQGMPA